MEKFLFFTGYPRSGHSIIGSFLDAHPNIVLSYAYFLFRKLLGMDGNINALIQNKTSFFNTIYRKSHHYSLVSMKAKKGYSLDVPGLWGGKFDGQLKVIGDKSALPTTKGYSESSPAYFKKRYDFLQRSLGIPLVGIHVVRNPFDMISTALLYDNLGMSWKSEDKGKWSSRNQYRNDVKLQAKIDFFFDKAKSVKEMVPYCKMKVLDVHSEDVVKDPKKELKRICEFLEVDCSEEYLQKCEDKCFREVSRTRDKVFWPLHLRKKVEENIAIFPFFRGYTFEEDYYNPVNV